MAVTSPAIRWLVGSLVLLQGVDFVLTWALLSGTFRRDVIEANPLARFILDSAGWSGLAVFKLGITLIVLLAVVGVARHRPALGVRVAGLMCLLMLGVNSYSGWLLASPTNPALRELAAENAKTTSLDGEYARIARFDAARAAICRDWREERISLTVALERMARLVEDYRPTQRAFLQVDLPDTTRPEQLAGYLYYHASYDRADAQQQRERLTSELAEQYPQQVSEMVERFMWPRRS